MLKLQEKRGDMVLIKEPYCIINAKHKLTALENKLLALLVTKIKESDEKFTEYEVTIKELQELLGIDYGESYNYLKEKLLKLLDIKITIEDEKEWRAFTILVEPKIRKNNGVIKFYFSPSFQEIIQYSKHYLSYSVEILIYLNSKYSLRLYKLLKDRYENKKKYKHSKPIIFTIDELKELLQLPKSYTYKDIKRRVLQVAKEEINKYTDIIIDFKEHKKGRKVERVEFVVKDNPNSLVPIKQVNNNKKEVKNQDTKEDFIGELRKINNTDKVIFLENDMYKIKDNLLFKNNTLLNKNEAYEEYKKLEKNKHKIKILTKDELKENNKEDIKEQILKIYRDKELRSIPVKIKDNIDYVNAYLIDIEDFNDLDDFVAVLKSKDYVFKMKLSLQMLKNYSI